MSLWALLVGHFCWQCNGTGESVRLSSCFITLVANGERMNGSFVANQIPQSHSITKSFYAQWMMKQRCNSGLTALVNHYFIYGHNGFKHPP